MGCVQSGGVGHEAMARNDVIETQLKRDALMAKNEIKILLFEAVNLDGKMRLVHHGGYNNQERESYKEIIISNTILYMRAVLDEIPKLGISVTPQNNTCCATIMTLPMQITEIPQEAVRAIQSLRQDPAIIEAIRRSHELKLHDSAVYYLNAINRIAAPGYLPSDQDILRSTTTKAGIRETTFKVGELAYRFFDPGQQGRDWRKWIHCFEGVNALVFLVKLSGYDQTLHENKSENNLQAALTAFDSICNSRWLAGASVILFLNTDTFAEKLLRSPLGDYFTDYQGGSHYDNACDYILHRFVSLNQAAAERQIYAHYVTDAQQIKFIMSAIQDILLQIDFRRRSLL
ncbi:guanine nucleotide-binding protein subunit alpha [Infundibulicybe gibba]|nr:guanine nucleotide-binding protein subunit alpha [Infundibulicybe gibba]